MVSRISRFFMDMPYYSRGQKYWRWAVAGCAPFVLALFLLLFRVEMGAVITVVYIVAFPVAAYILVLDLWPLMRDELLARRRRNDAAASEESAVCRARTALKGRRDDEY